MSWDVFASSISHGIGTKIYAMTDDKLLLLDENGVVLLDRKTSTNLYRVSNLGIPTSRMNENYLIHLKHELFEPYWCIEIFRHGEYEKFYERIVHRKKIYRNQFSLSGHLLGLVTMNTSYSVYFSVIDLRNGVSVHDCCERKFVNTRTPFFFFYSTPIIYVYNDLVAQTCGSDHCSLYCLSSNLLIDRIYFSGIILQLVMNDKYLAVLVTKGNTYQLIIQFLCSPIRTLYNLRTESFPQKGVIGISEKLFAFVDRQGCLVIFDFRVETWYNYNLNFPCTTIAVLHDSVYTSIVKSTVCEIVEIQFSMIPTRQYYLAVYKGCLGDFHENFDLKRYLLEFIGPPLYRGPLRNKLFVNQSIEN